jgi:hypothetical protein
VDVFVSYNDIVGDYNVEFYDENGTQLTSTPNENPTDATQNYYIEVVSTGGTGWYVPVMLNYGEDRDGDGYYTMSWSADCNDADPAINPGADDSNDTDGIDMNCDGIDGYNSNYES